MCPESWTIAPTQNKEGRSFSFRRSSAHDLDSRHRSSIFTHFKHALDVSRPGSIRVRGKDRLLVRVDPPIFERIWAKPRRSALCVTRTARPSGRIAPLGPRTAPFEGVLRHDRVLLHSNPGRNGIFRAIFLVFRGIYPERSRIFLLFALVERIFYGSGAGSPADGAGGAPR